jgi:hypothetical protein
VKSKHVNVKVSDEQDMVSTGFLRWRCPGNCGCTVGPVMEVDPLEYGRILGTANTIIASNQPYGEGKT